LEISAKIPPPFPCVGDALLHPLKVAFLIINEHILFILVYIPPPYPQLLQVLITVEFNSKSVFRLEMLSPCISVYIPPPFPEVDVQQHPTIFVLEIENLTFLRIKIHIPPPLLELKQLSIRVFEIEQIVFNELQLFTFLKSPYNPPPDQA
ncbi:MAG: hypothetical protein EZS28_056425, partial [Streblomastix strix]